MVRTAKPAHPPAPRAPRTRKPPPSPVALVMLKHWVPILGFVLTLGGVAGMGVTAWRWVGTTAVRESSLDTAVARLAVLEPKVLSLENALDNGRRQRDGEARQNTADIASLKQADDAARQRDADVQKTLTTIAERLEALRGTVSDIKAQLNRGTLYVPPPARPNSGEGEPAVLRWPLPVRLPAG